MMESVLQSTRELRCMIRDAVILAIIASYVNKSVHVVSNRLVRRIENNVEDQTVELEFLIFKIMGDQKLSFEERKSSCIMNGVK